MNVGRTISVATQQGTKESNVFEPPSTHLMLVCSNGNLG